MTVARPQGPHRRDLELPGRDASDLFSAGVSPCACPPDGLTSDSSAVLTQSLVRAEGVAVSPVTVRGPHFLTTRQLCTSQL